MIRTYQRRNKGGSSSQPDAFSPFESDSLDLISSYHSALSSHSQEGNAAVGVADLHRGGSQQLAIGRLGSLSSRLDLFAFDDEDDEDALARKPSLDKNRQSSLPSKQLAGGSQAGSPAKKTARKDSCFLVAPPAVISVE
jgi:hypothetical protein